MSNLFSFIGKRMAEFLTLVLIAFIIIFCLFQFGFKDKLDDEFFSNVITNMCFMLMAMIIWLPDYISKFRADENGNFKKAAKVFNFNANKINEEGLYNELDLYCENANEENRQAIKRDLLNSALMTEGKYKAYQDKTKKELIEDKTLTRKQKRILIRLNFKPIRCKKIYPSELTSNTRARLPHDTTNRSNYVLSLFVFLKLAYTIAVSSFVAYLVISSNEPTVEGVFKALTYCLCILLQIDFCRKTAIHYTALNVDHLNRLTDEQDRMLAKKDSLQAELRIKNNEVSKISVSPPVQDTSPASGF